MAKTKWVVVVLALCGGLQPCTSRGEQVSVRYMEGLVHGFLVLRKLDGKIIAFGDSTQNTAGDRVTTKLTLRFKDHSLHQETTEFSQRDKFQVIKYRLVQNGPAFKNSLDTSIDFSSGQITVRSTNADGKEELVSDRLESPPDVANGIVIVLLKNIEPAMAETTVSMVATTPKPRLVKIKIIPRPGEHFSFGGFQQDAIHYLLRVELGGAAGVVAPIVGKQPPDVHVWILGGPAPVFLRSEGPLFEGGPIWRLEQLSPTLPLNMTANSPKP